MKLNAVKLFLVLVLAGTASAWSTVTLGTPVDNYNTTDTTPTFNFTAAGNETSYSCELFINGSGYGTTSAVEVDEEYLGGCSGMFSTKYPCANGYDEDWTSFAKQVGEVGTAYVSEDYYVYGAYDVNLTWKVGVDTDTAYAYYLNWSGGWQILSNETSSGTYTVQLPQDGISTQVRFRVNVTCGGIMCVQYVTYYDGKITLIDVRNNTAYYLTANSSLTDGLYTWNVSCTANGITNTSADRNFTLERGADFISPTPTSGWNSTGNNSFNVSVQAPTGIEYDECRYSNNLTSNITMEQINATHYNLTTPSYAAGVIFYKVWCNDSTSGDWVDSETRNVTIWNPTADTDPAIIYNVQPTSGTSYASSMTTVTASYNTNEDANCSWSTNDVAYGSMTPMSTTDGTLHSQGYTVTAGNIYILYFRCQDGSGNVNTVSTSTTFTVVSSGGGASAGGTLNNTIAFRISPATITPGWLNTVKANTTWKTDIVLENLELFGVKTKSTLKCSKNNICAKDYCNLSVKYTNQPVTAYPEEGISLDAKKTKSIILTCTTRHSAQDGEVYEALLDTIVCKADDALFCDNYENTIQYRIGQQQGISFGGEMTLMDLLGYGAVGVTLVIMGLAFATAKK